MYTQQPYPQSGQGPAGVTAAPGSLLVADCGTVFTKVSLLGLVEGQYRLMARAEAPTTIQVPQEDITLGLFQAVSTIEFITGRRFLQDQQLLMPEQESGDGVDAFIATVSAGGPLRLVVLGAVSQDLETLVAQAISGLYAEMQALPAPSYIATTSPVPASAGGRPSAPGIGNSWTQERITLEWERHLGRLRELQPQAALIVGMADGPAGPNPIQEACQLLLNAARERQEQEQTVIGAPAAGTQSTLSVLYAAAPQYVEATRRMLQGVAEVARVEPLNSMSQLGQISIATGSLHERDVIQKLPGYDKIASRSATSPMATATSLSSLVRFLAQHYAMNVIALDLGGSTTTLMLSGEQGEFIPMVNTSVGMGPGIGSILQQAGLQRVIRWLPFGISEEEVREFVLNRMLSPHSIPASQRELQLSHAFAREAIALTVEATRKYRPDWPASDLILATGGVLAHAPKLSQVAMILLDALQPRGVTSMVLDKTMLISSLGAVAAVAPITAVQVNENDAVTHRLGTCVIPFGNMRPGEPAVRVGIEYSNGRQVNVDVMAGTIEVVPLRLNEQALLTLFPAPGVDVGLGPGERARAAEEIDGGLVGLIIDARGRPLALPQNDTERHARLLQWSQALGL
jgi:hypothetical protein